MKRRIERITTVFSGPFSKKRNGLRKSISLLLLGMMGLAASCISEEEIYPSESGGNQTDREVNFLIAVPYAAPTGTQTGTQSRAIGTDEENTIDNIYVLAFKVEYDQNSTTIKSETYDYSAIGIKSAANTEGASSQSFTVKVKVKDYDQRFVVITNAEDAVTALTGDPNTWTGKDKADMLAKLKVSLGQTEDRWKVISASDYTTFPMWGESGAEKITGSTNSLSMAIPMLRMVAKINVQLDETVSGLTNKFKMKSVHLYNTNTSGHVVPAAVKEEIRSTNQRYLFVEEPTVPSDAVLSEGPVEYTDFTAPGTPDVAMKGAIYTFETKAPSDDDRMKATCLVIGGLYDNDTKETYYRVDFFENDGTTLRDILRNYQYVVNITDVKGRGHESVDVAYKSKSVNMVAKILYWNEAGLGNNVFDGQNILSVSQDSYFFSRDAKTSKEEDNVLYVMTDYKTTATGGKSGWYVEKIVDANDETANVTWVDLSQRDGAADNPTEVFLTVEENKTTTERSAIIWIAAGRLRYPVKVTQSLTPALGIQLLDGSNNPVTELVFASSVGASIAPQTLAVSWQPKDADLTITNAPIGANGFPSGIGEPATGTVTAGNGSTGTITYIIQPTAFTDAELDESQGGNPFLEKISKVDFTTSNGLSFTSANVFLRQINYNMITDVKGGYMLNGQDETLTVRANFGWTITAVSDPDNVLQTNGQHLIGVTGGNNTTTGNTLNFSMESEDTNIPKTGKKATITFESLRDGSIWTVDITAVEALYVGFFGGALVEKEPGVWQFERRLYVQNTDESTGVWSTNTTVLQGTNDWDGKTNTFNLYSNRYSNPAAELCFKKNDNYAGIFSITDANYQWYLPAQKQLVAVWVIHPSFERAYQFKSANYWSSTEYNARDSWYGNFETGVSTDGFSYHIPKTGGYWVRCVREL